MEKKIDLPLNRILFKDLSNVKRGDSLLKGTKQDTKNSEFEKLVDESKLENKDLKVPNNNDDLKISAHAMKRISERELEMDSVEFMKIMEAINKLKSKGGRDSLVITKKAAYIVDVEKNTVVTAIAKGNLNKNIFTKIDSTVFID